MEVPILLPKIFDYPLTYKVNKQSLNVGDFVEVPFGKTQEVGVVWDKKQILDKKIKIKKIRSEIKRPGDQKKTLLALGLKKIGQVVEHEDTPNILGMINKVKHLVSVIK